MPSLTPLERAKQMFAECRRHCTCGGTDIGVGTMHEPGCGSPTPDDVARTIEAAILEVLDEARRGA